MLFSYSDRAAQEALGFWHEDPSNAPAIRYSSKCSETDCVAGVVGLELRNVVANYLLSPPDLREYGGILAIRVMRVAPRRA